MTKEKTKFSKDELEEFETLIMNKLKRANNELSHLKESIQKTSGGSSNSHSNYVTVEDGADAMEKEHLNQLAARTKKYVTQLENAIVRIKNGTYGICIDTGKLIDKQRLMAVPHTQHSIEAKLNRQ